MIIEQYDASKHTSLSLHGFFVDWPSAPNEETFRRMLSQSHRAFIAIDEESKRVVGFISAISDGVLSAYISLLEVLPEFQGKGIGSNLVKAMLEELKGFYMIDVTCDRNLVPFYHRFDFESAVAMSRRNYSAQRGLRT